MAQVQIGLGAVFGDEDLTVLERAHRARIHIQIRIQLQDRNPVAAAFQQPAQAGGHDSFADAGDNSAGDKDELGHGLIGNMPIYRCSPPALSPCAPS